MAGELKHAPATPVAGQLTQAEWESIAAHILDSGVAEDLLKWNGTHFVRIPKGVDGTVLGVAAGVVGYGAPTSPATVVVRTAINYTVLVTDDIVLVDTSAGNRIVTLPAVSAATKPVTIKKITTDTNTMTIDPVGTDTVEGDAAGAVTLGGGRASFTLAPDVGAATDNWSIV